MIQIIGLRKYFHTKNVLFGKTGNIIKAVDDVSFSVPRGTTFGLVGESGSGKTTIARLIVGILKADEGDVSLGGAADIVFQDPFSSLNPRMRVGDIVGESLRVKGVPSREIKERVQVALKEVSLKNPESAMCYPHQFSGGERQRIAIARAIICRPAIIILDEPVSSLDVSIQASILNLLKDIQQKLNLTYLFISHDLRVVEFMSDTVGVMKKGRLVEVASRNEIYLAPKSAYTRHLLDSIPRI